jgi:hypothetical protein
MTIKSLQSTSLTNNIFYRSALAGNDAFFPEFESDDFLEEVVLTSSSSSVTFSGLGAYAADYKHLQIRAVARMSFANAERSLVLRFNSDTSSNYNNHGLYSSGSSVASYYFADTYIGVGSFSAANATAGSFGAGVIDVLDAYATSKNTTIRTFTGAATTPQISLRSGLWRNTAALTSITLLDPTSDLVAGSRFSLYGSKG